MPVDVSAAAEQAMEQMGVTEEDINAQVEAATTPGATPAAKKTEVKVDAEPEEEEEVEVEEAEAEEVEETPAADVGAGKTIPIQRFNKVYRDLKDAERYMQALVMEREQLMSDLRSQRHAPVREVEPEADWDAMTPTEMARKMQTDTKTIVAEVVREVLGKEVAPLKADISLDRARKDMEATAAQYKDYWKFQEPMIEIAKAYPQLNAKQVYLLAKGNAPSASPREVVDKLNAKIKQKKGAQVERHSSPQTSSTPVKTYKNVKDIARAVAEKMGLDK